MGGNGTLSGYCVPVAGRGDARLDSMRLKIAAIRSGTDPVGKLPEAAFHRWLDETLNCPKCDASYNLVTDFDHAVGRFFPEESRRLIMLLKKAVFMGHGDDHRVSHFETEGVVVKSFTVPRETVG
jgi:hypothetical protein